MIATKNIVCSIEDVPSAWIFEKYTPLEVKLTGQDVKIRSIFNTSDNIPSLSIFCKNNRYFFKDFSTDLGGDGVAFVSVLLQIDRAQAINKILNDYREYCKNNKNINQSIISSNKYYLSEYVIRSWNESDVRYWWNQYHIPSKLLEKYNIKPLQSYTYKKEGNEYEPSSSVHITNRLIYGYFKKSGELFKIYQPYIKDKKFLNVSGFNYLQGQEQLERKDRLIICSSLKDGLCLKLLKNIDCDFVAPSSEGVLIESNKIEKLKSVYKYVYVLMDNDAAGLKSTERYISTYNLKDLYLKLEKDVSDSVKKYNLDRIDSILAGQISAYEQ